MQPSAKKSHISLLNTHIPNLKSHISHRISHISCMAYATLITDGDFFLLEAFAAEVELPRYRCCMQDIKCNHQQRSRISQYSILISHIPNLKSHISHHTSHISVAIPQWIVALLVYYQQNPPATSVAKTLPILCSSY